ncbi:hypothetical protein AB0C22_17990 [Micromonospora sp. NPDC048894]|uniref:hypothetical protein n=1 Tax=unclassified Micromonospora TaxID=2617518 RepID=UPI00340B4579
MPRYPSGTSWSFWSDLYATACRWWSLLLVAVLDEARLSHSGVALIVTLREL